MQISTKAWLEYIHKMSNISTTAADLMKAWISHHGFADDKALMDFAFALSQKYGEAIGALSCEMYEKTASAQGVNIRPAEPADTPDYGEVAKAVYGTMKQSQNLVPATIGRLVKQVGADTTLKNAKRDGAYFAWISQGDTCPYCLMMSAIGWQKAGKKTIRGTHADHIHPHCDCQYAIDLKGDLQIEGYDPEGMGEDILSIVDPDGEKYDGDFDTFLRDNGRQLWSPNGRDNTDLNILRRYMKSGERKRQLILDEKDLITLARRNVDTFLVKNSKYNIHMSLNTGLKQQGFDNIEKSIDNALKSIGSYDSTKLPSIFVLSPEEINKNGRVFALYNLITNELYLANTIGNKRDTITMQHILGFANPDNPNSTTLHELLHWDDAVKYSKDNGPITKENLEKYLNYQNERAIIKLREKGIDESNVKKISKYAYDSYLINDYDEVLTEYRTIKGV